MTNRKTTKTTKIALPTNKSTQATKFLKELGLSKSDITSVINSVTRRYASTIRKKEELKAQRKRTASLKTTFANFPIVKLKICNCTSYCNENLIIGTDIKICNSYAKTILQKFPHIETKGENAAIVIDALINSGKINLSYPPTQLVRYLAKLTDSQRKLIIKTYKVQID